MHVMVSENEQPGPSEPSPTQPAPTAISIPSFTAAGCQVQPSLWVAQLILSDISSTASGGLIEIPRFKVGLPWPLAKAVHQIMGSLIEDYERHEGPIGIPRSVQSLIAEQVERRQKPEAQDTSSGE